MKFFILIFSLIAVAFAKPQHYLGYTSGHGGVSPGNSQAAPQSLSTPEIATGGLPGNSQVVGSPGNSQVAPQSLNTPGVGSYPNYQVISPGFGGGFPFYPFYPFGGYPGGYGMTGSGGIPQGFGR